MKNLFFLLILSIFVSCDTQEKQEKTTEAESIESTQAIEYKVFGEDFDDSVAIDNEAMKLKYEALKPGDSIEVTFSAKVNSVCKKKGCFMKLAISEDEESMVRFKDYGFFVPKNLDNNELIVHGYAFIEEVSVDKLQHFAEDEGKSEEEIEAITEPKRTLSFLASGVKMNAAEYVEEVEETEEEEA